MTVTRSKRQSGQPTAQSPAPVKKPRASAEEAAEKTEDAAEKATETPPPPQEKPRCTHHLIKSEPESRMLDGHEMKFSVDDLMNETNATAHWDGVRNFEARNCMQRMKLGDLAFFYHSNTKKSKPGIVGIVEIAKEAYPDHTAADSKGPHYDPKHSAEDPRWYMVDVKLVRRFAHIVTLNDIKAKPELAEMALVKRGRISVQDVTDDEWATVLKMAESYES